MFTPEEVNALYGAADAERKTAILFGYFAGMRLSDAVARSWREIDLVAEVVDYVQGKTGRRVVVPLHPELASHLMAIVGDDPKALPALRK